MLRSLERRLGEILEVSVPEFQVLVLSLKRWRGDGKAPPMNVLMNRNTQTPSSIALFGSFIDLIFSG